MLSVWYRGSIIPGNVPVDVVHTCVCTCTRRCTVAGRPAVRSCAYVYTRTRIHVHGYMEEKCRNVPLRRQTSARRELKQSVRGRLHRFSTLPRSNPPHHTLSALLHSSSFPFTRFSPLHSPLPGYRLARVTGLDRSKVDWRRDATSY